MESQLILDRYRPLRELGQGGFATVVLAWDTRMQRRVAIKRLQLIVDGSGRPHSLPGLSEARTAAMLTHPAIVTPLDFDTDADEAFIVMEYVDGASLADLLTAADGPLTLDECAAVVDSVADALEHAHDNGVLHLDIKPENVLITRDGRIKVTDFGIAALSNLTGHGAAYGGTPGYMPIEQIEGRDVTERTDVWAFGALVFEALTGVNPFGDDTSPGSAFRIQVYDVPSLLHYEPDLPLELDEVLQVALGDRPADRYGSVAEFAAELLPLLGEASAGRASLAELVASTVAEEPDGEDESAPRIGLWDRLGGRLGAALIRIAGAAESGWLAWAGLRPLALEPAALMAAIALVALAAAFAPSLGVGLGIGCLVAGIATSGNISAALAVGLGGAAWWWFLAREHSGAAVLPLAAPALGAVRLGFAQPLLAGFVMPPAHAAATGALGGALMYFASAATMHSAPYSAVGTLIATDPWSTGVVTSSLLELATSPAAYVAWAGWPLAAAIMSLTCARATRASAFLGAFGGAAALAGTSLMAQQVAQALSSSQVDAWAGPSLGWSLGASLILMLLVAALGAPMRAEPDEPLYRIAIDDEELAQ